MNSKMTSDGSGRDTYVLDATHNVKELRAAVDNRIARRKERSHITKQPMTTYRIQQSSCSRLAVPADLERAQQRFTIEAFLDGGSRASRAALAPVARR
mmetsp:Transcript_57990/g.130374  ORF Transcript_57990/g.130374 Transcript_57990/m.130374 type:complete len:98 (+) Transcript_57990:50-343(+)